ncbi:diguanylate cyclase [Haliovirga abyssi]|uniref:GGDEF domain-containing protein n=1 Tax=Haliovirga abyssi TaxID=2996794 RepID=A0AAU9DR73_9FUSO|nr:diguanylate cyclase [Haliovirga abyssi]BDU51043.1 hypothetical protein HLVA_16120 [Haliovirga abyssi]
MKLKDKIFRYVIFTDIIITTVILIITSLILFNFFTYFKTEEIYLNNGNFKNYLSANISEIDNFMNMIANTNDVVFLFDKNKLISKYASESLKKELMKEISKKKIISEIEIINNNGESIHLGEKNKFKIGETLFIYKNSNINIIILKKLDSYENKKLIVVLKLSKIFENYLKNNNRMDINLITYIGDNIFVTKNNKTKTIKKEELKKYFKVENSKFNIKKLKNISFYITESKDIIYKHIFNFIVIFIILLIIIIFLLYLLSNKISKNTTNSIINMIKSVEAYDSTNFVPIEIKNNYEDEIKLLTLKFNNMGKDLSKYIHNLEEIVSERTKKLELQKKELKILNNKLKKNSITDELTGLNNRRYFDDRFIDDFKMSSREGFYLHFSIIDIDHFKNINDTYGHLAGDFCLKKLGKILKENLSRANDKVFRYGGEEFVFYYFSKEKENFLKILEKLRQNVENEDFIYENEEIQFTISIGGASMIPNLECCNTYNKYMKMADDALYKSKETGRNRVTMVL